MPKPQKKDFEVLVEDLSFSYRQFCLNQVCHQKVKNPLYKKHQYIWNSILKSLERDYIFGLARFFDRENRRKPISTYYFLGQQHKFRGHERKIKKVTKLRHKWLAHLDRRSMHNWNRFLKEVNWQRAYAPTLFDVAIETINDLKENFGLTGDLKQTFRQEKSRVINEFDVWFEVFKKRSN